MKWIDAKLTKPPINTYLLLSGPLGVDIGWLPVSGGEWWINRAKWPYETITHWQHKPAPAHAGKEA